MTETPIGHGTVLAGRFRLEDLVQDTDGAKFWRATDQILARNVAVNVVATADPRSEALLVAARTSATVTEGHFLRVLDAAKVDGVVYVVHEWGAGVSLDKMLSDGPLPPRRAAWLVKEVADAITVAHAHGIAHGRLLPENVMVTEAGSVKLIGFLVDAVLHGGGRPTTADGRQLSDHESDVLNLAALLYATLVAKWPGTPGSKLPEAPRDHGRVLRPRQVRAGVPRPLDAICGQVLSPGSTGSVPVETAHEISAALSDFIGDPVGAGMLGAEPTAVMDRADLARFESTPEPARPAQDHEAEAPADGPSDETAGEIGRPPVTPSAADPEATQAGEPLFLDPDRDWAARDEPTAPRYQAPPPPPLPEPEGRPLFAPGPPRPPMERPDRPGDDTGSAVRGMHSASGTGSLPAVWGPDEPIDAPDAEAGWDARDSGKDWLKLAASLAAVVVLVVAIVLAYNLGRDTDNGRQPDTGSSGEPSATAPAEPLGIAGVSDLDPAPDGNGEENPELAPLAIDGQPGTAWETMEYLRDPQLGLLKDGVGLVVDLGSVQEVSRVDLTLIGEPTSLELYAAPEGSAAPEDVADLERIATARNAGTSVELDLDSPVSAQYLVVWLTSVPPSGSGFRGRIAEIVVRP